MVHFLNFWINILCNNIAGLRKQSLLKIAFIFLCSVLFLAAEFFVCYRAFLFIKNFPGVGSLLSERLMFLFYFALFLMLIFSNAVITYSTMYCARDVGLLFAYPIKAVSIFKVKFVESIIFSSWAFLVLLTPFMISFGMANESKPAFYLGLILFFIPFLIIACSIGSGFTMLLVSIMPGKKLKWVIVFIGIIAMLSIILLMKRVRFIDASQSLEVFVLSNLMPNIRMSHSPFLPNYWMVEGMLKISRNEFKDAIFYFLLLLSSSLFFMDILMNLANTFYLDSWLKMHSQVREKIYMLNRGIIERLRGFFRIFGTDICGLIAKDMKLFWRDASQWIQFVVFFGLLGVYFLNIRNFPYYNTLKPFWKNICAFLNLSATLLTLGSLSTRFIFPQISLEGNKFWIIGLAPIGLKKVLRQKFWTSALISLFITETLIIVSNRMLDISGLMMWASLWVVFIMNFALIGLGVGLGAAFPDFKSENPARIVSGFGGTLTLMLNIGFILLAVILLVLPFQLFFKGYIGVYADFRNTVLVSLGLISLIGAGLCIGSLFYGEKRLAMTEF